MTAPAAYTATYTTEGALSVDDVHLGYYDADGGEWVAPVDALLTAAGWRRTGNWTGDDAPVERIPGTAATAEVSAYPSDDGSYPWRIVDPHGIVLDHGSDPDLASEDEAEWRSRAEAVLAAEGWAPLSSWNVGEPVAMADVVRFPSGGQVFVANGWDSENVGGQGDVYLAVFVYAVEPEPSGRWKIGRQVSEAVFEYTFINERAPRPHPVPAGPWEDQVFEAVGMRPTRRIIKTTYGDGMVLYVADPDRAAAFVADDVALSAAPSVRSAWLERLDSETAARGSASDAVSHACAEGQFGGLELDTSSPLWDDDRLVVVADNGWTARHDPEQGWV